MATQPCVLVVDDDGDIRDSLRRLLNSEGFQVLTVADGDDMFKKLSAERVDIILLDLILPGQDGFDLCRQLRADPVMPPILMITAKDQEIDRVVGLELGADDYIVKPFSGRELVARIKVVLRRIKIADSRLNKGIYIFCDWSFNPARMELIDRDSTVLPLSTSENNLLLAFVQNPKVPLSRDRLLDLTKGKNMSPLDRSIDSHVSRLRRKLEDDAKHPEIIKTAWGKGYIFTREVELA